MTLLIAYPLSVHLPLGTEVATSLIIDVSSLIIDVSRPGTSSTCRRGLLRPHTGLQRPRCNGSGLQLLGSAAAGVCSGPSLQRLVSAAVAGVVGVSGLPRQRPATAGLCIAPTGSVTAPAGAITAPAGRPIILRGP